MLWQPPLAGAEHIYSKQHAPAVIWLRKQLNRIQNITDSQDASDDYFDAELQQQVRRFQQSKHLLDDGIAGPLTLIHLQNDSAGDYGPTLRKVN